MAVGGGVFSFPALANVLSVRGYSTTIGVSENGLKLARNDEIMVDRIYFIY